MPRAFGGIYTADKDPSIGLLMGQSTNNAASLIQDAKNGWGLEVTTEMFLRQILGWLKEFTGIDLEALADLFHNFFDNLTELFGDLNPLSGHFNPLDALTHFWNMLLDVAVYLPLDIVQGIISWFGEMGFQPITQFLEQLIKVLSFGVINEGTWTALERWVGGLFNVIPIGSLTTARPNLLPSPAFEAGSIPLGTPDWGIDTDSTRSEGPSGSLYLECDGHPHAIRSGRSRDDYIKVSPGQSLTASIAVSTENYMGTSDWPILLQIVPLHDASTAALLPYELDPVTVDKFAPLPGDMGWPGHMMTGSDYVVPEGVHGVQLRLYVSGEAQSGILRFDDANLSLTGLIAPDQVSGLPGIIQGLIGRIQTVIDSIVNVFTGGDSLLHSLEELTLALLNIPFGNVIGVGGPTNIGQSIMAFLDSLLGGLVGTPGSGGGLADVFNIANIVSSMASLGRFAWELLGVRNNTPVATGLLPTSDSNYPYANANTYLAVTQSTSLCVTYRTERSAPLGVVSWLGYGSSGITAFYVNIRKIDPTTGARELVHHSNNIVANLPAGSSHNWVFYELPEPIPRVISDEFEIQLVPVGGTHYVKGYDTGDTIPDHPNANVLAPAAIRNETSPTSPTQTIAKASVTSTTKVMWIETAIDTGNATGYYDPVVVYLTESTTIPIPKWAGYIEGIILGGGGGGRSGGTFGLYGEPGYAGKWAAVVWERGVHFDANSDTLVTFTCGAGGVGGVALSSPAGGNGGASSLALTGHTLTAAGGVGGHNFLAGLASHYPGQGAGDYTFNDQHYVGGGAQFVYGAAGAAPGGGGMGGNWVSFQAGGPGAVGGGWIRFRQGAIEGGGDLPDTTPPTTPTLLVDETGFTTITVTATGAIDS